MAVPRLAEEVGVTPRVFRYWVEQGLVSPTREHGNLRFSPRDLATARLVKLLIDAGVGIDGVRVLRRMAEREVSTAAADGNVALGELALRVLYQRKAFREATGMDEERYPVGPPHPPAPGGPPRPPHERGPRPPN